MAVVSVVAAADGVLLSQLLAPVFEVLGLRQVEQVIGRRKVRDVAGRLLRDYALDADDVAIGWMEIAWAGRQASIPIENEVRCGRALLAANERALCL